MDTTTLTDPSAKQPIAGAEILGHGMNPFGDLRTVVGAVCETMGTDREFVFDNTTYYHDSSIVPSKNTSGENEEKAFTTRQEYQTHLNAKLAIKGSYGAFSGRFQATFGSEYDSLMEKTAALKKYADTRWSLHLEKRVLTPDFEKAAGLLPTEFRNNELEFFRFFQTFGAFVVTDVTVGGSMEYSLLVQNSHVTSAKSLETQIAAEYGTMFQGTGSSEQREQIKNSSAYTERRLITTGGKSELFAGVNFADPKDWNTAFQAWTASINGAPVVVSLKLDGINTFVPDKARRAAVETALVKYLQGSATVESTWTQSRITVTGSQAKAAAASGSSLRIVVLDRTTLQKEEKRFPAPDPGSAAQAFADYWAGVQALLEATDPEKKMVLGATERWPRDRTHFPTPAVQEALRNHGARQNTISRWDTLTRNARRCSVAGLSYVLAGAFGKNSGVDALAVGFGKPDVNLNPTAGISVLLVYGDDGRIRIVRDEKPVENANTQLYVIQNWTDFPRPVLAADVATSRVLLKGEDRSKPEQYWYFYPADMRYGMNPYAIINYLTCGSIQGKVGGGESEITPFNLDNLQDDLLWDFRGDDGKSNMLLVHYKDQNWNLSNSVGKVRVRPWFEDFMYWQRHPLAP